MDEYNFIKTINTILSLNAFIIVEPGWLWLSHEFRVDFKWLVY